MGQADGKERPYTEVVTVFLLSFNLTQFRLKKVSPKNVEHKNVLLRLPAWMMTDVNIIRYGMEAANKLLYDWQLKGKEIHNKAKYCNTVWICVGKAAMGG